MTDTANQPPDAINPLDSSIIKQQIGNIVTQCAPQIAAAVIAILAVFGITIGPEKTVLITMAVTAFLVAAVSVTLSVLTILHRMKRPCPPIIVPQKKD